MLPVLLGKQPCLNFAVTFLFNPVAGIFQLPVKKFIKKPTSEKGKKIQNFTERHFLLYPGNLRALPTKYETFKKLLKYIFKSLVSYK